MALFRPAPRAALSVSLFLLLTVARGASSQAPGIVRGTVSDSVSRTPVAGAQVSVTGTNASVLTNDAGEYRLAPVRSGTVTVRVQRIGYGPAERRVAVGAGETAVADFVLKPTAMTLSGMVVVGYGTTRREDVSTAISSISGAQIANTPVAGLDGALQGRVPGVQVIQNAGNPGNGITVRVRGPASINAGNQPLFVVDGVPILQDNFTQLGLGGQDITGVTGINPDEIESIDVLKDAASAGIYGSRGSNGVIVITTKRGMAGQSRLTFSAYTGMQEVARQIDLLNSQQYVDLINESARNDSRAEPFVPGVDDVVNTNWQDAIFRRARVSDLQMALSGGNDRLRYLLSGSFFDQVGIVIGSAYDRASGRLNVDFDATDRFSLRTSLALTRENNARVEGDGDTYSLVSNAVALQPFSAVRRADGSFTGNDEDLIYPNPVALGTIDEVSLVTLRALGNVEGEYRFTDRLRLTGRLGLDVLSNDETQWNSPIIDQTFAQDENGIGKSGHTTANRYLMETFLTADPLDDERHRLSILGGMSAERARSELNYVEGHGFTTGFRKYVTNASTIFDWDGSSTEDRMVSFFTRANYSFARRYLFTASVRADGSSRFGPDNRYGFFPAASVGWLLTEEPFAAGLAGVADVKLRASYGATGNNGISDFAWRSGASAATYSGTPGIAGSELGNPGLQWETTRELDLGLDLGVFGGRVSLIADYYRRITDDLLVRRPVAATSGFTDQWSNVGSIRNTGVDLGIETINFRETPTGLGWRTNLNITVNRNEVTSLYQNQQVLSGVNSRTTSIATVGEPLGSFYMLKFTGVDPATGNAIFDDLDDDGSIGDSDRQIVGNPHPDYFGGLGNDLSFRGFDLRAFVEFSQGGEVFNMTRLYMDDGGCSYDNKSTEVLRRWQQPGDITDVPRMSFRCRSGADEISSRFIEDASYVRIQEITLGYRLPQRWAGAANMSNARVFVSGRNLHTFTDYTGYSPDVNSGGSDASLVMNTDFYTYPYARTISFGISAGW
jgi:TonB-linked SusC/RagA family outer membrane protein